MKYLTLTEANILKIVYFNCKKISKFKEKRSILKIFLKNLLQANISDLSLILLLNSNSKNKIKRKTRKVYKKIINGKLKKLKMIKNIIIKFNN